VADDDHTPTVDHTLARARVDRVDGVDGVGDDRLGRRRRVGATSPARRTSSRAVRGAADR
jgi:hypothetical protein